MSSAARDRAEWASSVAFFILEVKSFRVSRHDSLNGSMPNQGCCPVQHEGRGVCECVDSVVIGKLGYGQPFVPVVLALVHKEPKELFDFLIDSLGLTISLGVVGSRSGHFDP